MELSIAYNRRHRTKTISIQIEIVQNRRAILIRVNDRDPLSSLQWRHNERDGVSNHRCLDGLLSRLLAQMKKNIKALRH